MEVGPLRSLRIIVDDLEKFVDFLYEGLEGVVSAGCLNGQMEEKFYQWPNQKSELIGFITEKRDAGDVYLTPALLKNNSRNKFSFKVSQVVWADFDGTDPTFPGNFPESHIVIQSSSPTKVHMYWRVPPITDLNTLEDLNKRIAYGCNADIGCWDATRFLRPPQTINHKYVSKPETRLVHYSSDRLGNLDLPLPDIPVLEKPVSVSDIPNAQILFNGLSPKLKEFFTPKAFNDRSDFLMRAGYTLAEEGYNLEQVVSLVALLDHQIVGKFSKRADKLQRYIELAAVAVAKVEPKEKFKPGKLLEILQSKDTIEWVMEGWIHKNGLMLLSGSPGVGKTQLASQLLYSLSTGNSFLGRSVTRPFSTMFLSLEMKQLELQYFFQYQVRGLTGDQIQKWNEMMNIFDPMQESLDTYGELIRLYNPEVVVIDSVSELAQEDMKENEARKITRWWDKIRYDTDTALVVLHHDRKPTADNKAPKALGDVYGSYLFTKVPETVVTLWEDTKEEKMQLIPLKTRMAKKVPLDIYRDDNLWFHLKGETTGVNQTAHLNGEGKEEFTFAGGQFAGIKPDGTIHLGFTGSGN